MVEPVDLSDVSFAMVSGAICLTFGDLDVILLVSISVRGSDAAIDPWRESPNCWRLGHVVTLPTDGLKLFAMIGPILRLSPLMALASLRRASCFPRHDLLLREMPGPAALVRFGARLQ
jgi:hypothetical protein